MKLALATLGAWWLESPGTCGSHRHRVSAQATSATVMLKYSREMEEESDHLGLKFMERPGMTRGPWYP